MKVIKSKFSDFESKQITKEQQKTIKGGDGDPIDPRSNGGGNGNGK